MLNMYLRVFCVVVLVFTPQHLNTILQPYDCVAPTGGDSGEGEDASVISIQKSDRRYIFSGASNLDRKTNSSTNQYVMRSAPEVQCRDADWNYYFVKTFANIGFCNFILLFTAILKIIRRAFKWQIGNKVRDVMPPEPCIIEAATVDMKGYVHSLRHHVEHRNNAVPSYHLAPLLVERRGFVELLEREIEG
jgi:hypothetical protein